MQISQSIFSTAQYLKQNLENIRDDALRYDKQKKTFLNFKTASQAEILAMFIRNKELIFYKNVTYMLTTFQSRYYGLFARLENTDSEKYAQLASIAAEFPVLANNCATIQVYLQDQMQALDTLANNFGDVHARNQFNDAFVSQMQMNVYLEKYFEKKARAIPQFKKSIIPWINSNVAEISRFKGFARAAAMMILTITLFLTNISAAAGSAPFRTPNITTQPTSQSQTPQVYFQMPSVPVASKQQSTNSVEESASVDTFSQTIAYAAQEHGTVSLAECADFIKYWEGFRPHAYTDSKGYLTIGYGTCIEKVKKKIRPDAVAFLARYGLKYDQVVAKKVRVSPDTATKMMLPEIQLALTQAQSPRFPIRNFNQLPKEAQLIIVDMIYNLGMTNFLKFVKTIAAFNAFDFASAAVELRNSKWYTDTARRAEHHVGDLYALAQRYKRAASFI